MAVTIVDGEMVVEAARVDTFEYCEDGLTLLEATETAAQSNSAFCSDYRRQLEEALSVNADMNKVRKKLEKVQELNVAIQQGTHDPSITKEGSVAEKYQQWLDANDERLQRVRVKHRSAHPAPALTPAGDVGRGGEVVAAAAPTAQPVITEEDLAEMLTCHRELLAVLASVELDPAEEAEAAAASAAAKAATAKLYEADAGEAVATTVAMVARSRQEGGEQPQEQEQADEADEVIASIPLVAPQPATEYVNDWDREVYGVEEFDDDLLDDFESSMAGLMNDEFASMRAQVTRALAPVVLDEME